MEPITIYFDGGCRPNPGEREIAVVFACADPYLCYHDFVGPGTNNEAEFLALLWALDLSWQAGFTDIHVCGDSSLVVRGASGQGEIRAPNLLPYLAEYTALQKKFANILLEWVPRERNLAGIYLERRTSLP
jgi:ribonuclease HI